MKRKIIRIDQDKCNGCGKCIPDCPEGALQMIDGKARLVSDLFCDGLGACIGTCPVGAITTEEREAAPYDERKVMENIIPQGTNTIKAHLKHLKDHNEDELVKIAKEVLKENNIPVPELEAPAPLPCGCPGTLAKLIDRKKPEKKAETGSEVKLSSELSQWPIQLHLINPNAPYFKNADIVVAADCVSYSFADFHREYLKGRKLIIFCPKLDASNDAYVEKLTQLFQHNDIKSVSIVRMEVPCCGGTEAIVKTALQNSGKTADVNVDIISISGEKI